MPSTTPAPAPARYPTEAELDATFDHRLKALAALERTRRALERNIAAEVPPTLADIGLATLGSSLYGGPRLVPFFNPVKLLFGTMRTCRPGMHRPSMAAWFEIRRSFPFSTRKAVAGFSSRNSVPSIGISRSLAVPPIGRTLIWLSLNPRRVSMAGLRIQNFAPP